jgi:Family of unknown function (DUF5946)
MVEDDEETRGDRAAYDELASYTLTHGDPAFIHQHVVDAFAAQHATEDSKTIGVAFALIGLYLHLERGRSGREVQQAHMRLGRRRRQWPTFDLPPTRGEITIHDVVAVAPGPERDRAIDGWCASVWDSWSGSRERVIALLGEMGEAT